MKTRLEVQLAKDRCQQDPFYLIGFNYHWRQRMKDMYCDMRYRTFFTTLIRIATQSDNKCRKSDKPHVVSDYIHIDYNYKQQSL